MFTHCQDMKIVRRAGAGEADGVANRLAQGRGEGRGRRRGRGGRRKSPTREGAGLRGNRILLGLIAEVEVFEQIEELTVRVYVVGVAIGIRGWFIGGFRSVGFGCGFGSVHTGG